MEIPDFTDEGVLPVGTYKTSLEEIKNKFCSFGDVNKREKLYNIFIEYLNHLKKHTVKLEVYIDGSFITDKKSPGDIDILVFYDFEYTNEEWQELICDDYIRYKFSGIQVLPGYLESDSKDLTLDFAQDVKGKPELRKGLIEVIL